MRFLPFALTCLSFLTTGTFAADTCTFTSDDANFNIQPLQITANSEFQGQNKDGAWSSRWQCLTEQNCPVPPSYEYRFNLCAPLLKSPKVPAPSPDDGFIAGCDGEEVKDGWNAYQYYIQNITNVGNKCYPIAKAEQSTYTLIKDKQPSQGFMIKYGGGGDCTDTKSGTTVQRSLTVHVRCSANLPAQPKLDSNEGAGQFKKALNTRHFNTLADSPTSGSDTYCNIKDFKPDCHIDVGNVYEPTTCQYHVNVDTVLGCPQSCRIGDTACSNRGICAEDTNAKKTRCFCDIGYGGEHCENAIDSSAVVTRSPNTVLTVFVLILLFAALGLGYALYRKIRGFHGDFDHQYGQLAAKPDQVGNLQNA